MKMAKDYKKSKPIDRTLLEEGKVTIMDGSLPFEPGELDKAVHTLTTDMSKTERENGFVTKQLPYGKNGKYFYYDLVYNEDGNHLITKYEGTEDEFYD